MEQAEAVTTVTVILVNYNMAEYLDRCIQSIISQTYSFLEILIVDDGSEDGSAEIIERYRQSDPRVRTIYQENKGHSEARNVGMSNANSNYFFFIDADDYIRPECIEILMKNLKETDADISIGSSIREGDFPVIDNHYKVLYPEKALRILVSYNSDQLVTQFSFNPTWNRIFKKELFENIKFPTGHVRDDNFTCHRLLGAAKKIVWTGTATYFYTRKLNSMSEEGLYANKDLILAHEDRVSFLKEKGYEQLLPDECSYYLLIAHRTFMKMGDYGIIRRAKEFINENRAYIEKHIDGKHNMENITSQEDIIIYTNSLTATCGIVTWTLNFCEQLSKSHKIKVVSMMFRPDIRKELELYADTEVYSPALTYRCRTLIQNYQIDGIPSNFMAAQTYIVLHCDYSDPDFGLIEYPDRKVKYIAVSEVAAGRIRERFNIDCMAIKPFLSTKKLFRRIFKFVSATRLTRDKGIERMKKLAGMFKDAGVRFQWLIFCDRDITSVSFRSDYPELIVANSVSNYEMLDYMKEADFVIQLSDSEGFCYAVHEALLVGTPVIVTDIPVFDMVIDGYNGYKVPLDIENHFINVLNMVMNIPKDFDYDPETYETRQKWINILGGEGNAEDNQTEHTADTWG